MKRLSHFLSTADAARILGVTPATVRLMVKRGDLPTAGATESGIRLFHKEDVEKLAMRREERREREAGHEEKQKTA